MDNAEKEDSHLEPLTEADPEQPNQDEPDSARRKKFQHQTGEVVFKSIDEPDRVSVFSLFMEKDFRYYFQHPYFRIIVAYLVTFCNFLIYAEDPVAHSEQECFIPVVGNCFSFVCSKYPPNGWAVLKVILWLIAIISGMVVGKLVVHQIIFNRLLKLKMFHEDHGSWMTMFFTVLVFLFLFSWIYNAFLLIGGEATVPYRISSLMGIKNATFMKAAATGTWCGDFFTAWMVTDIMLQEKLYPNWAAGVRRWWNRGAHRVYLFWIVVVVTSVIVVMVIGTDWIKWDKLNQDFMPTNELGRGFLASFILVMDLVIVMQDWDFPHFINNFDIKLPGLNTAHIKLHVPKCLRRPNWVIHIAGKWFNYGIIFFVMILDLNMWKNQIFYKPFEYGQYTCPNDKIHTVRDEYSLNNHNETYMSYEYRVNTTNPLTNQSYIDGDMIMNSKFHDYPLKYKGLAFIPTLSAFVCLGVLVSYFGRWKPTEKDPHGGRLKRRPKRRSWLQSGRKFLSSLRKSNRDKESKDVQLTKVTPTTEEDFVELSKDETDNKKDDLNNEKDEINNEKCEIKNEKCEIKNEKNGKDEVTNKKSKIEA